MIKKVFILLLFGLSAVYSQNDDSYNRFRLGQSYEQSGNYDKAKEIYESLYNKEPLNYQFFEALNRVYIQLKNFDGAVAMVEKRLSINSGDINMYGMLGSVYHQKGDDKKAFEVWDEGLAKAQPSSVNYRVIANYAMESRAFEKAAEVLEKGKKLSKDIYSFSFELANLYSILMKFKEAAEEYCYILSQDPNQITSIQSRISAYVNKPEAFSSTIEVVEKQTDKSGQTTFQQLLGWLYMENNDYQKAYDVYLKIDKQTNSGTDLLTFAQRALSNGYYDQAADAYKKVSSKYKSSPFEITAQIGYAKTMETVLNKKNDSQNESWMPFPSKSSGSEKEYNEVIKAYQELIDNFKRNPIAAESYYRIGLIKLNRLNDAAGAEQTFKELLRIAPVTNFSIPVFKSLAEISIIKNNLDQAAEYYNKILNIQSGEKSEKNFSEYMLAKIEFWKGNFPDASRELDLVTNELSDNIANDAIELSLLINTTKNDSLSLLEFARADLLIEQKQYKEASGIFKDLSQKNDLLTLKDLSSFRYAQMVTMLNDLPNAIALLEDLSQSDKGNVYADKALLLLGKIYQFGVKDLTLAKKSYEKLLANFPNSLYLDDARENITAMKIN